MIITPRYTQISLESETFSPNLRGKWYCSYAETYRGETIHRYMSPNGWQRTTYYFDTKREAEAAFLMFGRNTLPVTEQEYQDARMIRDDIEEMFLSDIERELDVWEDGFVS